MDFLQILVLTLYITLVFTKSRRYKSKSSEEGSIENLLYYKDCQRSAKPPPPPEPVPMLDPEPPPAPPPPPPPPASRQPECPFPKMCCALTCGNECGGGPSYMSHMQYQSPIDQSSPPNANPNPLFSTPVQPQIIQRRKKKVRIPSPILNPPLPTRRDFSGVTKDRIKGLISQDNDIRKILKDLVRVTMQKVDLQDMLKANQKTGLDSVSTARSLSPMIYEMDDYVE